MSSTSDISNSTKDSSFEWPNDVDGEAPNYNDFDFPFIAWIAVALIFLYALVRTIYKHRRWMSEHEQRTQEAIEAVAQEARERREFVKEHLESYIYEDPTKMEPTMAKSDDDEEAIVCPICMEDLKDGEKMALSSSGLCSHKHFHHECMEIWLCRKNHNHCPMCRMVFMKEDLKVKSDGNQVEQNNIDEESDPVPVSTSTAQEGMTLPSPSDDVSSPQEEHPSQLNSSSSFEDVVSLDDIEEAQSIASIRDSVDGQESCHDLSITQEETNSLSTGSDRISALDEEEPKVTRTIVEGNKDDEEKPSSTHEESEDTSDIESV